MTASSPALTLHESIHVVWSDSRPTVTAAAGVSVTRCGRRWPRRRRRNTSGRYLVVLGCRNGFGTAFGLIRGRCPQRHPLHDFDTAATGVAVYSEEHGIASGRWRIVGHDDSLLTTFPLSRRSTINRSHRFLACLQWRVRIRAAPSSSTTPAASNCGACRICASQPSTIVWVVVRQRDPVMSLAPSTRQTSIVTTSPAMRLPLLPQSRNGSQITAAPDSPLPLYL